MNFKILFVSLVTIIEGGIAAKIPPYITACKNDANLNECAKRSGQNAIQFLVQGDKTYKIPNMLPLKIQHIEFDASKNLKIALNNVELFGLESTIVESVNLDLKKNHFTFKVLIPQASVIGNYDVNGRILILPIQGKGPCNITLVGGTFDYELDYDLQNRKGDKYINIKNSDISYDIKRLYVNLENLFNGDKNLGDQMNRFINENWKEVSNDIGPAITETISQIVTQITTAILKRVPYDELILN